MESLTDNHYIFYSLVFIIGACVGSFINVVALRSLAEKSWISPPSACPHCNHRLGIFDLIPIVSYFLLGGKCRYCKAAISWHYPLVEAFTALWFVLIIWHFDITLMGYGMLFFSSVLIAITITDFREKLIPHEITYPSILIGIFFTAVAGLNVLGTMAGIGASYILFDFIAFYGLKIYPLLHPEIRELELKGEETEESDTEIDRAFGIVEGNSEEEEFEVMGGGDAVLAALISAWLGWEKLIIAVMLGFVFGALLGGLYLLDEMKRVGILGHCIKRGLIWSVGFFIAGTILFLGMAKMSGASIFEPQWGVAIAIFTVAGGFCGFIFSGRKVSRPFPFGPALAAGAAIAMFVPTEKIFSPGG